MDPLTRQFQKFLIEQIQQAGMQPQQLFDAHAEIEGLTTRERRDLADSLAREFGFFVRHEPSKELPVAAS